MSSLAPSLVDSSFLFQNLTSLVLLYSLDHTIDSSIVKHLENLEHLVLDDIDRLFSQSLKAWAHLLPNLVSLKLLYHGMSGRITSGIYFEEIGAFIEAHPKLRQVYLDIPATWDAASAILPVISRLDMLEVFGFAPGVYMPPLGLEYLLQNIPVRIKVLSLSSAGNFLVRFLGVALDDLVRYP
jgi:hypothetical protein